LGFGSPLSGSPADFRKLPLTKNIGRILSDWASKEKNMIEITVKVPKDVKDIVSSTGETIYVEALNEVAFKRIPYLQKQIEEYQDKIRYYEAKYKKDYIAFSVNVPDSVEGHDDWIEWTYLIKVTDELLKKIDKLRLLKG
jgi:hypothetical protein